MKRSSILTAVVLLILAILGWAGWANWEYRKQAAERQMANTPKGVLVAVPTDGSTAGNEPQYVSPLNGKPAPAFTLEDLSGNKVSLNGYKGKAVLINFWATWCAPCKIETPWLIELRNKYAAQGFEVLGVSAEGEDLKTGDTAGLARQKKDVGKFVQQMKVPYPILINGDSISKSYGSPDSLPTSFYVDKNGNVVVVQMGINSEAEIEGNIRKALGQ